MTLDIAAMKADREAGTPGPWRVGPVDDTVVVAADGSEIAAIDGDYNEPDLWPMMEANARLIALAPDLAAALLNAEEALTRIEGRGEVKTWGADEELREIARAALSDIKAITGGVNG